MTIFLNANSMIKKNFAILSNIYIFSQSKLHNKELFYTVRTSKMSVALYYLSVILHAHVLTLSYASGILPKTQVPCESELSALRFFSSRLFSVAFLTSNRLLRGCQAISFRYCKRGRKVLFEVLQIVG